MAARAPEHRPGLAFVSLLVGLALSASAAGRGTAARVIRTTARPGGGMPMGRLDPSTGPLASRLAGILTILAVTSAYLGTLSPTTDATDSVEFQIVARTLRIAHAPGYPLYTLLGHVAAWLPVADVAWRLNLFSALAGTVAAALAYALAARLMHDPLAGALAALSLAFTPQLWSQAVITEVYALNMALVLGILAGLVRWTDLRGRGEARRAERGLYGVLTLCGLAFAHHLTSVFLYPVIAFVVLSKDPRSLMRPADVGRRALAFCAGLTPFAYLPWRWRAVNGVPLDAVTFLRFITGRNYPGLFDIGRLGDEPARWVLLRHQLHDAFAWPVLAVAVVGAVALLRRRPLWATALCAVASLYGAFYLGYFAWDGWVVLLPALAAVAVSAGVGATALAAAAGRRVGRAGRAAVASACAVLVVAGAWRVGPRVDASRGWAGQAIADRALAEQIPTGARLVVDPSIGAGFLFDRHLKGIRSDLDVVYADWPAGRAALADPLGQDRAVVTFGLSVDALPKGVRARAIGPLWLLEASGAATSPEPAADGDGPKAEPTILPRSITRRQLAHDPAFASVTPMRRAWPDGVVLVGLDAPASVWPGQTFSVDAYWTQRADAAPRGETTVSLDLGSPAADGLHGPAGVLAASTAITRSVAPSTAVLPGTPWPGGADTVWITRLTATAPSSGGVGEGASAGAVAGTVARASGGPAAPPPFAPRLIRSTPGADPPAPGAPLGRPMRVRGLSLRTQTPGLDGPVRFDDGAQLVAFLPRRRIVAPGDWLAVRTEWSATRMPAERDKAFVQLLDAAQTLRASSDREILYGAVPTDTWLPGATVADVFYVRVPHDMPPGPAWLQVGLYDKSTRVRRAVLDAHGQSVGDRHLTGVFVAPPKPVALAGGASTATFDGPRVPADVAFEGGPRLTAVGLPTAASVTAGRSVTVTLRWQVDAPIARDWTVFVHLLERAGSLEPTAQPAAQADGMPFGDIFPTHLWPRGATLVSAHRLIVPDAWDGRADWALAVGLYDARSPTFERALARGRVASGTVESATRRVIVYPAGGEGSRTGPASGPAGPTAGPTTVR